MSTKLEKSVVKSALDNIGLAPLRESIRGVRKCLILEGQHKIRLDHDLN